MIARTYKPGLIGKKIGMTQYFNATGESIGVTVVQVGPCVVTQVKKQGREGYHALQLGFDPVDMTRVDRARRGHFEKKNQKAYRVLQEIRFPEATSLNLGQTLSATLFSVNDLVDVTGISKGKGFQGVIKRHHKAGGPASHGSRFHRSTGSIGQRTWPGRVFRLMKLPGHMGDRQVTTRNLRIVDIIPEQNYILIAGAVPGPTGSIVVMKHLNHQIFLERLSTQAVA